MTEAFKTRMEVTPEALETVTPGPVQPVAEKEKHPDAAPNEEYSRLDVYEHEKGHKISEDYFNVREIMVDDFNVKMNVLAVDKYIKQLMKAKSLDNTVDNFKKYLGEIETEIGSRDLDIFARLHKLVGYIKVMGKMSKLEEDKKRYLGL